MIKSRFLVVCIFCFTSCNSQINDSHSMKIHTNHLAEASSPYLQQHAHNPVDWYEWGEEALNRAKKENKPILISIGYAACHWCHVMAHESFEDSLVAAYMNAHFINIKIDREERPDIDQIYMQAAQLISGRGGWPLNAFALPDGRPFFAGTYFPKENWMSLLQQIHTIYKDELHKLEDQATALTEGINKHNFELAEIVDPSVFKQKTYNSFFSNWDGMIDYKLGGFNRAPKFPLPVSWEFLLQYHYLTKNKEALRAVETTLSAMAKGGIYDQIGGGFARYSVDEQWLAPHFEKMLYDNGQLVSLYSHAYQINKNPDYARVIEQSLEFVERELTSTEGGFYSSLDADSEGEEGKFYVWTQTEIEEILKGESLDLIREYYQIKEKGNWEHGKNILHTKLSPADFEKKKNLENGQFSNILKEANLLLLEKRSERIRPGTDDKILSSWNALMLKGYIEAFKALGKDEYLTIALKNASFLEENMIRKDGSLWRNYKDGKTSVEAFLDDYALMAEAFMNLYQVSFNKHWLDLSKSLMDYCLAHFSDDKTGLLFYTSDQSESLIARKHEVPDNVIPSSNSVAANVLYRLGLYFDNQDYSQRAHTMLQQVEKEISTSGPYHSNWAMLYGMISHEPFEVAIMGDKAIAKSLQLQKRFLPTTIFLGGNSENLSLLENKLINDKTLIYICRNKVCQLPVENIDDAIDQIGE